MPTEKKRIDVEPEVHERLSVFGRLGETYSDAIRRALDEAGAPSVDEVETR